MFGVSFISKFGAELAHSVLSAIAHSFNHANFRKLVPIWALSPFSRIFSCSNNLKRNSEMLCVPDSCALLTPPSSAVLRLVNVVRAWKVGVSMIAGCFATVMIGVLPMSKQIQVVGIYTSPVSANVVYLQSICNFSIENQIRNAVTFNEFALVLYSSVSFSGNASSPVPTSRSGIEFKLLNKPVEQWSKCWHNGSTLT